MHPARRVLAAAVAALVCLAWAPATPAADAQPFLIRTAYTEVHNGVYYLNAGMQLQLDDEAIDALSNGVPLVLKINIEVTRRRTLLWDSTVAHLTQSYELNYHALSRRFIVRNLNSGRQASFDSYQTAMMHLSRLDDVPVIDAALLAPDEQYNIRMRAVLDIKLIPTGFQLITSLFSGAEQATDWRQWALRP